MVLGKLNEQVFEDFSVADSPNSTLVTGLDSTSFVVHIFNPSNTEVSGSIGYTITELGFGHYRLIFTPNQIGTWYVILYNTSYFPMGKHDTVQVYADDFDSISNQISSLDSTGIINIDNKLTSIENKIDILSADTTASITYMLRALGLMQENFSIDQAVYDADSNLIQSRIRIYSDGGSVGTDSNVIATYIMEATYSEPCKMDSYKVVKQ